MKIQVLMENTPLSDRFLFEHGLSVYIETEKHKILYDTGKTGGFVTNAELLGVDLTAVDVAFISHAHHDHGGGLKRFLEINDHAAVYLSCFSFEQHFGSTDRYNGLDQTLKDNPRLIPVDDDLKIDEELELFSCNERPRKYFMDTYGLKALVDGVMAPDDFRHELYLIIHEHDKLVLFSGCSHKGVTNIMNWFSPDVFIGGFHYMDVDPQGDDKIVLDDAARILLEYDTRYYTCHCTGLRHTVI